MHVHTISHSIHMGNEKKNNQKRKKKYFTFATFRRACWRQWPRAWTGPPRRPAVWLALVGEKSCHHRAHLPRAEAATKQPRPPWSSWTRMKLRWLLRASTTRFGRDRLLHRRHTHTSGSHGTGPNKSGATRWGRHGGVEKGGSRGGGHGEVRKTGGGRGVGGVDHAVW